MSTTSDLRVPLPPELEEFRAELEYFVASMVRKLHINRYKGNTNGKTIGHFATNLIDEYNELVDAMRSRGQFEVFMEAVDVANIAFLLAAKTVKMTKKEYEVERNDNT
jgi:hypothetical protein